MNEELRKRLRLWLDSLVPLFFYCIIVVLLIQWAWNTFIYYVFELKQLTFWQSAALLTLIMLAINFYNLLIPKNYK